MRRNRFDPENPEHVAIHEMAQLVTREARRSAGHRGLVHQPTQTHFPRRIRRLLRTPHLAQKRMQENQAMVNRTYRQMGLPDGR